VIDFLGKFGEPTGVRTLDLLIKSQLLYQLSYRLSPFSGSSFARLIVGATASVACVYAELEDNARGNIVFFNRLAKNCHTSSFAVVNSGYL
jgi:hypothetical protein